MAANVRLALRHFARDRSFTVAAVAALALGLAGTVTMFTIINGVLLRDLPVAHPDRMVAIETHLTRDGRSLDLAMSYADLMDVKAAARVFTGIAGVDQTGVDIADAGRGAEHVDGAYVSANTFDLLGRQPILGRGFDAADDQKGSPPVVILGHALWRNRYAGDPRVVGQTMRVNGMPTTIVGVMPEGFGFPQVAQLWLPLAHIDPVLTERRGSRSIEAFGIMAPGITVQQAAADVQSVMTRLAQAHPETNAGIAARVQPYREATVPARVRALLGTLLAAAAFLLLIACANVANLLLARGATRGREIAVRVSLGASRAQVIRQLLVESVMLAAIGGLAGWPLAVAGVSAFDWYVTGTGGPYWLDFPFDGRVVAFLVACCLGTAAVFGLIPALHGSRPNLSDVLNAGGRGHTTNRRTARMTGGLVVLQLALALVLLTAGMLTMREIVARSTREPGFEMRGVSRMEVTLTQPRFRDPARRAAFYRDLEDRLAALPGVQASLATWAPMTTAFVRRVTLEGTPETGAPVRARASSLMVGPRFFATLGLRLQQGRDFTSADSTGVAIVNEQFAALHFGGQALGHSIKLDSPEDIVPATDWLIIVGVVPDIRHEEADPRVVESVVYLPHASVALPWTQIVTRSTTSTAMVAAAVRRVVGSLDADLPLTRVQSLEAADHEELWQTRMLSTMFGIFATIALALAAVGLYGITAYSVAQRTREIGVRIALGARSVDVWLTIMRRPFAQLAAGVLLGGAGAVGAGRILDSALSAIGGTDPVTFALVPMVLVAVAMTACVGPAIRAIRLDPAATLRGE